MAIDDGVDFVGALDGLIDALRIATDDALARTPELEKFADVVLHETGMERDFGNCTGPFSRKLERVLESFSMGGDIGGIDQMMIGQPNQ